MSERETISAAALSKLRWRCRRGMLENDLLIDRFFVRSGDVFRDDADALTELMKLDDPSLLELFLGRQRPAGDLDTPEVHRLIAKVRVAGTPDHATSNPFARISP